MRTIKEIHKAINSDDVATLSDAEVLWAREFYDDLAAKLIQCPDLRGVLLVAVNHESKFRSMADGRGLKY